MWPCGRSSSGATAIAIGSSAAPPLATARRSLETAQPPSSAERSGRRAHRGEPLADLLEQGGGLRHAAVRIRFEIGEGIGGFEPGLAELTGRQLQAARDGDDRDT